MTGISVQADALVAAAQRLLTLRGETERRALVVASISWNLDMDLSSGAETDERLRSVCSRLGSEAQKLDDHARFLAAAAARYRGAEDAVRAIAGPRETSGPGAAAVGFFRPTGPGTFPIRTDVPWLAVSRYVDDVLTLIEGETHLPIGAAVGLGIDVVHYLGKVPGLGAVGTVLTLGTVLNEVERGDVGGLVWDAAGLIPYVSAFQFGYGIGEFVTRHTPIDDWVIGRTEGAEGWAPNYDTLGVRDALNALGVGLTNAAGSIGAEVVSAAGSLYMTAR